MAENGNGKLPWKEVVGKSHKDILDGFRETYPGLDPHDPEVLAKFDVGDLKKIPHVGDATAAKIIAMANDALAVASGAEEETDESTAPNTNTSEDAEVEGEAKDAPDSRACLECGATVPETNICECGEKFIECPECHQILVKLGDPAPSQCSACGYSPGKTQTQGKRTSTPTAPRRSKDKVKPSSSSSDEATPSDSGSDKPKSWMDYVTQLVRERGKTPGFRQLVVDPSTEEPALVHIPENWPVIEEELDLPEEIAERFGQWHDEKVVYTFAQILRYGGPAPIGGYIKRPNPAYDANLPKSASNLEFLRVPVRVAWVRDYGLPVYYSDTGNLVEDEAEIQFWVNTGFVTEGFEDPTHKWHALASAWGKPLTEIRPDWVEREKREEPKSPKVAHEAAKVLDQILGDNFGAGKTAPKTKEQVPKKAAPEPERKIRTHADVQREHKPEIVETDASSAENEHVAEIVAKEQDAPVSEEPTPGYTKVTPRVPSKNICINCGMREHPENDPDKLCPVCKVDLGKSRAQQEHVAPATRTTAASVAPETVQAPQVLPTPPASPVQSDVEISMIYDLDSAIDYLDAVAEGRA